LLDHMFAKRLWTKDLLSLVLIDLESHL